MAINSNVHINPELCTGCGLCLAVCPSAALELQNKKAVALKEKCMACDHCAAICPAQAIHVDGMNPVLTNFSEPGAAGLSQIMRTRRSCRNYKEDPVPAELLQDLVKIGVTAPSGTNSQTWAFTILPERQDVRVLGNMIGDYFRKLNRLAGNFWLRHGLKLLGNTTLAHYHQRHQSSVERALIAWDKEGRDLLFHGAPSAIVVSSRPGASCPKEDCLLSSGQIGLAAHALGLGTCLIGYAVAAMNRDTTIQERLGIPTKETVQAVIILGWPSFIFPRPCGRKPFPLRVARLG